MYFINWDLISPISICAILIVLLYRIIILFKDEPSLHEYIILGICISDLIFGITTIIGIYVYENRICFIFVESLMVISFSYSIISALMISYISW